MSRRRISPWAYMRFTIVVDMRMSDSLNIKFFYLTFIHPLNSKMFFIV
jgi:hypothetical protein